MSNVVPFERPAPTIRDGAVPPVDLNIEADVLVACTLSVIDNEDQDFVAMIRHFLRPEHFYSEAHRRIFEAILAVHGERQRPDPALIGAWLNDRGRLAQVGGFPYLRELAERSMPVIEPRHVREYARQVHAKWRAREVIRLCQRTAAEGYGDYGDVQDFVGKLVRSATDLMRDNPAKVAESNAAILRRIYADAKARGAHGSKLVGVSSGFESIDRVLLGYRPGTKNVVAAMTGVGKTAFALNVALNLARQGRGSMVVSVEMDVDALMRRLQSMISGVPAQKFEVGWRDMSFEEHQRSTDAANFLAGAPIRLFGIKDGDLHVDRIVTLAYQVADELAAKGTPLEALIVDYVQKLPVAPPARHLQSHREQVNYSTWELKKLAQSLPLAVVELAQQKACEGMPGKNEHQGQPIADTSMIAKDADTITYLWRPNLRDLSHVVAVMAKVREGQRSFATLNFDAPRQRFTESNPYARPIEEWED